MILLPCFITVIGNFPVKTCKDEVASIPQRTQFHIGLNITRETEPLTSSTILLKKRKNIVKPDQTAFFEISGIDIVITREESVTPEAKTDQGEAFICFKTDQPNETLAEARNRGTKLPNNVVKTSFGTEGFFTNDPAGLAIYVGTPWQS